MQKIRLIAKEKSLAQLEYYKQHYQRMYPQAKQKGKIVLRHYLKKLNVQIQRQQEELLANIIE